MSNVTEICPASVSACHSLWLAVIYRQLEDLASEKTTEEALALFASAFRWFFLPNSGFREVCALAGTTPALVRSRAREILNNPELLGKHNV